MNELYIKNNKGSAGLEAALVLPLLILGMLAIYHMCMVKLAEGYVYEAAVETAEYMAEFAYVDNNGYWLWDTVFRKYLDNPDMVERYIRGGVSGIDFFGTIPNADGYVRMHAQYEISFVVPVISAFNGVRTLDIKQKAYVGENTDTQGEKNDDEKYVYITENKEVYHVSRLCSYLMLTTRPCSLNEAKRSGYRPCAFCDITDSETIYITDYGNCYHSDKMCSGLKRTVNRVKLSETGGVPACTRCGEN